MRNKFTDWVDIEKYIKMNMKDDSDVESLSSYDAGSAGLLRQHQNMKLCNCTVCQLLG